MSCFVLFFEVQAAHPSAAQKIPPIACDLVTLTWSGFDMTLTGFFYTLVIWAWDQLIWHIISSSPTQGCFCPFWKRFHLLEKKRQQSSPRGLASPVIKELCMKPHWVLYVFASPLFILFSFFPSYLSVSHFGIMGHLTVRFQVSVVWVTLKVHPLSERAWNLGLYFFWFIWGSLRFVT